MTGVIQASIAAIEFGISLNKQLLGCHSIHIVKQKKDKK